MTWNLHALLSWLWRGSCRIGMPSSLWSCSALRRIKTREYHIKLGHKNGLVIRALVRGAPELKKAHTNWYFSLCPRLSASSRIAHLLPEEQVYLNQQSGTIRLDCFTHCLIVKCAPDITVSPLRLSASWTRWLFSLLTWVFTQYLTKVIIGKKRLNDTNVIKSTCSCKYFAQRGVLFFCISS